MNETQTVRFRAMAAKDIKAKAEAFKVLFGQFPIIRVSGTVEDTRGSTAWLTAPVPVLEIGTRFVRVECEGEWLMDVAANASVAWYSLSTK